METIASAYAIETDHLYQLSPQQLISCDYYPSLSLDGCRGGSLKEAFQTIRDVSSVILVAISHTGQALMYHTNVCSNYENSVGLSNPKPKGQPSHCLNGQT